MAEDQNNGLALKSRDGYTGKLFLPSTADIATLNTAQADITTIQNSISTIDPTARFIVAATEPSTADDGKIWIEVEPRLSVSEYHCKADSASIDAWLSNSVYTIPVLITDTAYTYSELGSDIFLSDLPSGQILCCSGQTISTTYNYAVDCSSTNVGTKQTVRVNMQVTGPLELTIFKYHISSSAGSDITVANYSKNSTSASFDVSYQRHSSAGTTWDRVYYSFQVTPTGLGTGSIAFSPSVKYTSDLHYTESIAMAFQDQSESLTSYVYRITN